MKVQRWVLYAYGLLLRLYPPRFRKRFGPEMLELAGAAELGEWPLVLGDTAVGIVRCWVEGSPSTRALNEPNAYFALGGSPVRSLGLGFVLSTAIIFSLAYVGYRWPPPCPSTRPILTHVVAPPQDTTHKAVLRQSTQARSTRQ